MLAPVKRDKLPDKHNACSYSFTVDSPVLSNVTSSGRVIARCRKFYLLSTCHVGRHRWNHGSELADCCTDLTMSL